MTGFEGILRLLLPLFIGGSLALIIWALKEPIQNKFQRDVAWLNYAIWRFTPEPFDGRWYVVAYYIGSIIVLILLVSIIPSTIVALALWGVLSLMPRVMIERKWQQRRELIEEQLPGTVLKMSGSVASGMSLIQAIERLSEREPAPINLEFRIIARYWNMVADFQSTIAQALWLLTERHSPVT